MDKFIVTGDLHFRSENPRSRKDNYRDALLVKLYEVFLIAQERRAKAIIIPGDIFDSSNVSLPTIIKLASFLDDCKAKFAIDVLVISGNHDLPAGNKGAISRTPFGLLTELEYIHDLERLDASRLMLLPTDMFESSVTGCGFDYQTDTPDGADQYMVTQSSFPESYPRIHALSSEDHPRIHVVHSMLLAAAPSFPMRHTLIDDVETNADIIISGHYHDGFGIIRRKDGKLFINPGALCRLSASQAEMSRTVQVALLTVNSKTDFHAELIPLQSARPAEEVLDREAIVEKKEHENWLESFFDSLQQEGEEKFLEVREIIEKIATLENVPSGVKLEALLRIGEAREKLGRGAG
ncbi:metallophosphoesterase [Desulfitobacterium dehalogenans]|uniref:metallophosphoesterase n=1 Tax=Desulfitobacterium dehalogenans TaxID=36854 RepID=UPI0011D1928C|nr:metallophosphoesterase [Desulfitobacterium dehalogenans]